jgi:hypothetical protein
MSNQKTEHEMCELIARSREEAERGNYGEAYRLIRHLPLTAGDLPGTMILRTSPRSACRILYYGKLNKR